MPETDNGRVTLAVVAQKVDEVLRRIDRIDHACERYDTRIGALETGQAERRTQVNDIRNDVIALERKAEGWNLLNSLGAGVAAILAALGLIK